MSELRRLKGLTIELDKENPSTPTNKNKSAYTGAKRSRKAFQSASSAKRGS